jgi:ABC-type multidrug transport system permease subunit
MNLTIKFIIIFALPLVAFGLVVGYLVGNIAYYISGFIDAERVKGNYTFIVLTFTASTGLMAIYAVIKGYIAFSQSDKHGKKINSD